MQSRGEAFDLGFGALVLGSQGSVSNLRASFYSQPNRRFPSIRASKG